MSIKIEEQREDVLEGRDGIDEIDNVEERNPKSGTKGDEDQTWREKLEDEKLWVNIIRGNRNTTNEVAIQFVAPKVVNGKVEVELEEEDIIS